MQITKFSLLLALFFSFSASAKDPRDALATAKEFFRCKDAQSEIASCAKMYLAPSLPDFLKNRFTIWVASAPVVENLRICSEKDLRHAGKKPQGTKTIVCFKTLAGKFREDGFLFLSEDGSSWRILDIKY